MNFDDQIVHHLHVHSFQTIDLLSLKDIWSDVLPLGSYRVTDYGELNSELAKPSLLQLRWIDLTLPFGIYSNEQLVFWYDPYHRKLYTEKVVSVELPGHDFSSLDFIMVHSQTFHNPDSYSLRMEDAYGLSSDSEWREFSLPKVKRPAAFIADLIITLSVTSFQFVLSKNKFLSDFESWAKRTGSGYAIECSGKWAWSKTYQVSCDVSQLSEHGLHQLVSIINRYEEWEGVRFLTPTETGTVSLFFGGDLIEGYGFGIFQYGHPGEVISNEI